MNFGALGTILSKMIGKINTSVQIGEQTLSPDQQAQVKENLGIGASSQVQADWNQNDETAPDYVKNRTHYLSFLRTDRVLLTLTGLAADAVEPYEEDGVTKYRWTQSEYQLSGSGYISRNADKMLYISYWNQRPVYVGDTLTYAVFPDGDDLEFTTDITCSKFRLHKPIGSQTWIFTPYAPPEFFDLPSADFKLEVLHADHQFNTLPMSYLPISNEVLDSPYNIPTSSAVSSALRNHQVSWEMVTSRPFYETEDQRRDIVHHTFRGDENYETSSDSWLNPDHTFGFGSDTTQYVHPTVVSTRYGSLRYLGNPSMCSVLTEAEDNGQNYVVWHCTEFGEERLHISVRNADTSDGWEFILYECTPGDLKLLDEKFLPESQVTSDEIQQLADMIK